jgi:hypothetical protein
MVNITKKSGSLKFEKFYTLLAFFVACAASVSAQTSTKVQPPTAPVAPVTQRTPRPFAPIVRLNIQRINNETGIPAEKAISVDNRANVQLCIENGNVKVNGWDRNEVRAMIEQGSYVGFRVLNKTAQNTPAVVKIVGYDTQKTASGGANECLRGENIEIDVPRGATVKIEGRQFDAEISSVFKADVKNDGGDIRLNEIAQGVDARTYQGDLSVENSGGAISLSTTNGNIFAYNARPFEFSNVFAAKTNSGAINLQAVEYPQISVKSFSGAINFSGSILSGGQYGFETQNGSIQLNLPQKSSFAVTATYGYGDFKSEIPMVNVTKTPGQPQKLTGQTGTGDATLTLNTYVGSINIKTKE